MQEYPFQGFVLMNSSSNCRSDNKWIASQTQSNTDSFRRGLGRDLEEHGPTSFATEATDLVTKLALCAFVCVLVVWRGSKL